MSVREAMVVAGGAGTRLRPLTATTPKPLLEFCGEPFLTAVIRRLAGVGVTRVLLVVGADTAPFHTVARSASELGVAVECVPEPEPLDTAGGVRAVLERVSGPFLVLNADVLTDVDLASVVERHVTVDADVTLTLTRVEDPTAFGVCLLEGTRVVGFVEKPKRGELVGQDTVNAGTYVVDPAALERFPVGRLSFERTVFPQLVEDGAHVEGFVSDAAWADLGTPGRFLEGHRLVLGGRIDWPVPRSADGVTVSDTATIDPGARLVAPVLVRPAAHVADAATVGPNVVVGEAASVAAQVTVRDSVLFSGAHLGSSARRLIAGHGARVEAGAKLGSDVVLGDGARVASDERLADGSRRPDG